MDWTNISSGLVVALLPYFIKSSESIAKEIGKDVYQWLKNKFSKDKSSENLLNELRQDPESNDNLKALVNTLSDKAKNDPDVFGVELVEKVEGAKNDHDNKNYGDYIGQVQRGETKINIGKIKSIVFVNTIIGNININ